MVSATVKGTLIFMLGSALSVTGHGRPYLLSDTISIRGRVISQEWRLKNGNTLLAGGRLIWNGGFRYSPLDEAASAISREFEPDKEALWSKRIPANLRIDTRLAYHIFYGKASLDIALDIQNLTNRYNPSGIRYQQLTNTTGLRYHPGELIPLLSVTCQF